jgi:hypothetical protein
LYFFSLTSRYKSIQVANGSDGDIGSYLNFQEDPDTQTFTVSFTDANSAPIALFTLNSDGVLIPASNPSPNPPFAFGMLIYHSVQETNGPDVGLVTADDLATAERYSLAPLYVSLNGSVTSGSIGTVHLTAADGSGLGFFDCTGVLGTLSGDGIAIDGDGFMYCDGTKVFLQYKVV